MAIYSLIKTVTHRLAFELDENKLDALEEMVDEEFNKFQNQEQPPNRRYVLYLERGIKVEIANRERIKKLFEREKITKLSIIFKKKSNFVKINFGKTESENQFNVGYFVKSDSDVWLNNFIDKLERFLKGMRLWYSPITIQSLRKGLLFLLMILIFYALDYLTKATHLIEPYLKTFISIGATTTIVGAVCLCINYLFPKSFFIFTETQKKRYENVMSARKNALWVVIVGGAIAILTKFIG